MNPQNKYFLIIFELLFILILFIILPSVFIMTRPGPESLDHNQLISVDLQHPITQIILPSQNGLNSVSLFLKNPALLNRQNFTLSLKDVDDHIVRQLNFNGYNVGDPNWLPFKFTPIPNSQNQQYLLTLFTTDPSINTISAYFNNQSNSVTYKTTYKSMGLISSFKTNINNQLRLFRQRDPLLTTTYLTLIIVLNLVVLL